MQLLVNLEINVYLPKMVEYGMKIQSEEFSGMKNMQGICFCKKLLLLTTLARKSVKTMENYRCTM